MSEPITIALSLTQQSWLAAFKKEGADLDAATKALNERFSATVNGVIAATHDPVTFKGWNLKISEDGATIVCTPPGTPDNSPSQ